MKKTDDDRRYADAASSIYTVCIMLVPALAFLGAVIVSELIYEEASGVAVTSVALFSFLLTGLSYALAILSKLVAKVFRHLEASDLLDEQVNDVVLATNFYDQTEGNITKRMIERMVEIPTSTGEAFCPSCELQISITETQCPRCRANFLEGSPWAPIPKSYSKN